VRLARADNPAVVPKLVSSTSLLASDRERSTQSGPDRAATDVAAPQPAADKVETVPSKASSAPAEIDKHMRELSAQQIAENEYRAGATLLNNGRPAEAQERFRAALQRYPAHTGSRQALFGLLLNAKNLAEAEQVLQEGLKLSSRQPGFAMALARLQTERGDTAAAVETLQRSASAAAGNADYLAFHAALLQRQERHAEAAEHYRQALALASSGVWQMGLGISLQALNRGSEAQEAFKRAKASTALNPELQAFVDERLRQLRR
jgi:MSHA biogenesis protein MshN